MTTSSTYDPETRTTTVIPGDVIYAAVMTERQRCLNIAKEVGKMYPSHASARTIAHLIEHSK